MDYKFIKLPKSEAEVKVTIPFFEFEPHVKRAAALLSEEKEIEGFRRGKAPYDVVKNRFGEAAIYERAAEIALRKTYPQVMEKLIAEGEIEPDYPPIGKPEVTVIKLVPGNEFEYKVKVAILPRPKLPDYKTIAARVLRKESGDIAVSEEEIKNTLNWIRESRVKLKEVDRPVVSGDRVEVDFEVRHGGVKIEQGESRNHPLIVGQGKFLPGFEDELLGMKTGDEKNFTLVVPDTWHDVKLRGKALDFKVVLKRVEERQIPELTEEFVKSLGNFSSPEALEHSVREGIRAEKENKEKQRIRALMAEEIAVKSEVEIPEVLIEGELDKMFEEMRSGVEGMGMKWEDYLLHIKRTVEDLRKEWRLEAEKRVRVALAFREIAKLEKIEPTPEEIEMRANQFLTQFKTVEEAEEKIDPESLKEYTKGVLRNEKVFEFLERV
jgi:trigger factor